MVGTAPGRRYVLLVLRLVPGHLLCILSNCYLCELLPCQPCQNAVNISEKDRDDLLGLYFCLWGMVQSHFFRSSSSSRGNLNRFTGAPSGPLGKLGLYFDLHLGTQHPFPMFSDECPMTGALARGKCSTTFLGKCL